MSDDQLDDLKQFITTTVSQTETRLENKIDGLERSLSQEMNDGFSGVAEAIEQLHARIDDEHAQVDKRLTRLENTMPAGA